MLLYPILEWWFNTVIKLPVIIWGIVLLGLFILGISGLSEIRNLIFSILAAPIGLYLFCYVCKLAQELPLVGGAFIVIRLVVDVCIVGGIIMVVRYIMAK